MCARDNDHLEDEFEARVERSRRRIEKARRTEQGSFWRYLGLIGVVGWSVAAPMVAGALLGLWIDNTWDTGYSWTLTLLVIGLAAGCYNAWRLVTREM
jgi:ATP synthase protein I